jgi:hypothetical protein
MGAHTKRQFTKRRITKLRFTQRRHYKTSTVTKRRHHKTLTWSMPKLCAETEEKNPRKV